MNNLLNSILVLVYPGIVFNRFFEYLQNNISGNNLWFLFPIVLILVGIILSKALFPVIQLMGTEIIRKEKINRQPEDVNNKRELWPATVYVRNGRLPERNKNSLTLKF